MQVAGELGDFDLAGIVQLLGGNRASGRLHVTTGGNHVALYLDAGRLVAVASTGLPLRLGRILRQHGLVTDRQVREALEVQKAEGRQRTIGEILVARGWVTEAQIDACVHEQCVAVLARVLAAGHGSFVYKQGVRPPTRARALMLEAHTALLEALRRVDELGRLRALLPPSDSILTVSDPIDDAAAPLSATEARIVGALGVGAATVRQLVDTVQVDEAMLLRALIALRERGVVVATSGRDAPPLNPSGAERQERAPVDGQGTDRAVEASSPGSGTLAGMYSWLLGAALPEPSSPADRVADGRAHEELAAGGDDRRPAAARAGLPQTGPFGNERTLHVA
jgi:hypothetical protein